MAYQKLNTSRAYPVVPSDNGPIPQIMVKDGNGTISGISAVPPGIKDQNVPDLRQIGLTKGMVIENTTAGSGKTAIITGVGKEELLLNVQIFALGDTYQIYGGDNNGAVLYVGTAGDLRVLTAGGDDVTFVGVSGGSFIPVNCIQVFNTGTTASDIIALW